MPHVLSFDEVRVLQFYGPAVGGNYLYIVTGVAVINFTTIMPNSDGWTRAGYSGQRRSDIHRMTWAR
jgi:hypothetical protein